MAITAPLKKSPSMKKWMAQADPPKESSAIKKVNGRLLLPSSNKTTHHFKEWTTPNGILKKTNCLYRNLMFQIDLLNSSSSQKLQYPERKLML